MRSIEVPEDRDPIYDISKQFVDVCEEYECRITRLTIISGAGWLLAFALAVLLFVR